MTGNKRKYAVVWTVLSILVLIADYVTGPAIQFPIAFAFPVVLASWKSGRAWGAVLAVLLPVVRGSFHHSWGTPGGWFVESINIVIQVSVLAGLAYLVDRTAALGREIKVLKGMLPICSFCKKIRVENGTWAALEDYISERSEAEFTHGLCAECAAKEYKDFIKKQ